LHSDVICDLLCISRACKVQKTIYELKQNGTSFENLLRFHEKLHDLETPFEYADSEKCHPRNPGDSKVVFDFVLERILMCLPPKCASTSLYRAFAPIALRKYAKNNDRKL
jgi:hypothetical protein